MTRMIPGPDSRQPQPFAPYHQIPGQLAWWLAEVRIADTATVGALEFTPLVHAGPFGPAPTLLHDAIASGALQVGEHAGGVVNTVVARNHGKLPVLILEGESIVGAKQNRVVTADVMIAPGAEACVPVGCVERGRWDHVSQSAKFAAAEVPVEPMMRARAVREVREQGHLDQSRLWCDVDEKLSMHAVESRSANYHAFTQHAKADVNAMLQDVPRVDGQVGLLACADGRLVALDVLGVPENWASIGERLAKSYLFAGFDMLATAGAPRTKRGGFGRHQDAPSSAPVTGTPQEWIKHIAGARVLTRRGIGMGSTIGLESPALHGAGLWVDEAPAHLAVFGQ